MGGAGLSLVRYQVSGSFLQCRDGHTFSQIPGGVGVIVLPTAGGPCTMW